MAQDYKIAHFDPGKEPFIDRNGNQWVNVLFEGELSNPTKWVMRPDSVGKYKVGDTVYGRIEQVEGKNYQRFYKEQKSDFGGGGQPQLQPQGQGSKPAYQPKDEHAIAKAVALKAAVDFAKDSSDDYVLQVAGNFLAWLESDKQPTSTQQSPSQPTSTPTSGYDKAKQQAQRIRERQEDEDLRNNIEQGNYDEPPFDPNDEIPY